MDHPYEIEFNGFLVLCEERHIPAGHIFEMHWHDYIEIELILSGEAEHIHNSERMSVGRGHVHIITPHDHHAIHVTSDIRLLHICFESAILDQELGDALVYGNRRLAAEFPEERMEEVYRRLMRIADEENGRLPLRHAMAKGILQEFLIEILRYGDESLSGDPTTAQRLVAYVGAHFREALSIMDVAKVFSLSPNYAGRKFREQTGMSFHDYLNVMRLQYACNLLKYSSLAIREIAVLSGYASIEYFLYIFKKHIGMTPTRYRMTKEPR